MNSWHIAVQLLRRSLWSKKGIIVYLIVPVLVVSFIMQFTLSETTHNYLVYYTDQDGTASSQLLVKELSAKQGFTFSQENNTDSIKNKLIEPTSTAAIIIPKGWEEGLMEGQAPQVELLQLKSTQASVSLTLVLNQLVEQLQSTVNALKHTGFTGSDLTDALNKTVQEMGFEKVKGSVAGPANKSLSGLGTFVGFILLFILSLGNSVVSLILDDRKQKTMARMFTAPVRASEIAFGNFLGGWLVGSLQIALILVMTKYVFKGDLNISFLDQFIVLECFLLAALGLASTIAGLVRNANNVGAANMLIIIPSCMLGGCFWPVSIMPDFMQKVANFIPQYWAIDAFTRLSEGQGLSDIGLNLAILGLFAVILISLGSVVLKPGDTRAA